MKITFNIETYLERNKRIESEKQAKPSTPKRSKKAD